MGSRLSLVHLIPLSVLPGRALSSGLACSPGCSRRLRLAASIVLPLLACFVCQLVPSAALASARSDLEAFPQAETPEVPPDAVPDSLGQNDAARPETSPELRLFDLIQGLDQETKNELFIFVASNTYFALQHEIAEAVVEDFVPDVSTERSNTVDDIAAVQMSNFSGPSIDLFISNGLIGRFALNDLANTEYALRDMPRTDPLSNRRFLCVLTGSNMANLAGLALDLGFPQENLEACPEAYLSAFDRWHDLTWAHKPPKEGVAKPVRVAFADSSQDPLSMFIRQSGLLETVGRQVDRLYDFPKGLTLATRTCGEPKAYFSPKSREVVLCDELVNGFAWGYVALFIHDRMTD